MRHTSSVRPLAVAAILLVSLSASLPARAQGTVAAAPPSGVLTLDANASTEVLADTVRITMFTEIQGNDPAALSRTLTRTTQAAMASAKQQTEVKVHTGSLTIAPSTDKDGKISTWRGRSELILESQDFEAASHLAGALGDHLQIGGVGFSLSPQAQRQAESGLLKDAIAAFRQQALAAAESFGYKGFTVREVNVGHSGGAIPVPRMMLYQGAPAMAKASAPLPIEAGTTTVSVSVNGSVQMTP